MEEQNEILKQVFGESSDSDDEDQMSRKRMEIPCKWEQARKINGLWICQNFLSPEKQEWVLSAIQREEWFSEGSWNQAMRFGNLPYWAIELSQLIREAVVSFNEHLIDCITPMYRLGRDEGPLPMELLWREPLFDQLIANVYQPDEFLKSIKLVSEQKDPSARRILGSN